MRRDTFGTSGHATTKSSICKGMCFVNWAFTLQTSRVLPREVSAVLSGSETMRTAEELETVPDRRGEVSRGRSTLEAGKAIEALCSKDGATDRPEPQRRERKARTVPREGIEREEHLGGVEERYCIRRA